MDEKLRQHFKQVVDTHHSFAITTHRNPDGDAIGSSLAMGMLLESLGKEVCVIFPNEVAPEFEDFPYMEKAVYANRSQAVCADKLRSADVLVCLDFNTLGRTGSFLNTILATLSIPKLLIDHHENPDAVFDVVYSEPSRSSTAEMVYEFVLALYPQKLQTRDIISCIYTGVFTDTGGFRFSTSARTHTVVAHLIQLGLDTVSIYQQIYQQNTLLRIQLQAYLIYSELTHLSKYNTSYITVSSQTLRKFSCKRGDYEGVVNVPLTLRGAKLSCIFIEEKLENKVKLSLRSKGSFSVADFAADHFDGGGHRNAAGAIFIGSLRAAISKFTDLLASYEDLLK